MVEHVITEMQNGKKLHRVVRQMLPGVPLSGIYKMLRTGRVKLNGKKAKSEQVVSTGDLLSIWMQEEDYEEVRKSPKKFYGVDSNIDVLCETDGWMAVNKPAGVLTHDAPGEYKNTLVSQVLAYLYRADQLSSDTFTPAPVHRLDRNTSGIVLFAKNGVVARELSDALQSRDVEKSYLALVVGTVIKGGTVRSRLERVSGNRTEVSDEGVLAMTDYYPIASAGETTVVGLKLVTGRTHQIRIHMRNAGHPLVDDVKYNPSAWREVKRQGIESGVHQWLHALRVVLRDGQEIVAPIPEPMRRKLKSLGYSDTQIREMEGFRPPSR
ncbi:MAG: RluA family pseudouridine synthase [Alicyclobacillaceae bacterium]|nr:RluA family pseudouridine synthase [Alicyclobacillaceae bacterium]